MTMTRRGFITFLSGLSIADRLDADKKFVKYMTADFAEGANGDLLVGGEFEKFADIVSETIKYSRNRMEDNMRQRSPMYTKFKSKRRQNV